MVPEQDGARRIVAPENPDHDQPGSEQERREQRDAPGDIHFAPERAHHHDHPGKPDDGRGPAMGSDDLFQDQDRQDRQKQRAGERHRRSVGQVQVDDRVIDPGLAHRCDNGAEKMEFQALGLKPRASRADEQRRQKDEPDSVAEQRHLRRVNAFAGEFHDDIGQHEEERAAQDQDGALHVRRQCMKLLEKSVHSISCAQVLRCRVSQTDAIKMTVPPIHVHMSGNSAKNIQPNSDAQTRRVKLNGMAMEMSAA